MKKGFTLLETVIAISLLSMCVIGFLQALNVAMLGSDEVRQSNGAAEIARSQMEYIQQRDFIVHNDSEQNKYGNLPESELASGFTAANINTTVNNVSGMKNRAIQQITVNVSYSGGKHYMKITDYKTPRLSSITGGSQTGWLVTENVDIPALPGIFLGSCWGYYYTFETGTTTNASGPISIMWQFETFFIKHVTLYLYGPAGRSQFPTEDSGLIQMEPPATGCISAQQSWWGADREICAIEMTGLPPGEYTAYYYNSGLGCLIVFSLAPSQSTITYIK